MTWNIRRVVTGHDKVGKAIVAIDEPCRNLRSGRAGHQSCVVWSTASFPADNSAAGDAALRPVASTEPNGVIFRIVRYEPGVAPRMHRTESLDCAVVMSGEIDMELDNAAVHLKAGDVLVQRGTIHNWVNRGAEACVIAFVLVAAESSGRILPTTG